MRYLLTFLLAFVVTAMSADVKPFVFETIGQDSATQQNEFEYMLQYKLFGRDYMSIGNDVTIKDKSGWNGTRGDLTVTHRMKLGGPTLVAGDIKLGDGNHFTTGPIRGNSLTIGNDNGSYFTGEVVLKNDPGDAVKGIIARSGGTYETTSSTVPEAPSTLSIPTITWPDTISGNNDIYISANNGVAYIDIPDGDDTYDLYLNAIHTGVGGTDGSKLYIRMQDGGRLTRIFVKDLKIGNHTTINVVYRTAEGDVIQSQKSYRGNLMFYTDADITFERTDNVPIQGSFLTTKKLYLACNLDFAGQLLANQLEIGNTFNGENFRFVKFDPDTLDIDPELDKYGGLRENDSTVTIPIKLSDTATVDVYFNYCFDLRDGVTVDDFNLVTDFPICGQNTKTVVIPTGKNVPTDTIKVNVKKDTIVEPSDYLIIKISIESGAVLPNNKTDGELKVKIIDADFTRKPEFDTTAVYSENENYTGYVTDIKVLNKTDSTRFILDSAFTDRYSLDSVTGALTLLTPVDYENQLLDTIKVTLKDGSGYSVTGYIPINVLDVNEAPEITTASINVSENLPVPTKVGTIVWTDQDIRTSFRDNAVAVITPADGLTVNPDGSVYTTKVFDFEEGPAELEMVVRVYDKSNPDLADTATVKFVLTNVNESPSVRDTTFHVHENYTGSIGKLIASDPEGKGLTYTVTDSKFKIGTDGTLSNTVPFDYESTNRYTVTVKVSDGTMTSNATITVIVDNVNEPVHVNDTTFTVDEGRIGTIGQVKATDEDGTSPTYTVSDSAKYTISSYGVLSLKTPFDYEETKSDTVLVFVSDGEFKDTAKVVINVHNINVDPVLVPDTLSVPENCSNCSTGTVVATDADNDKLTYEVLTPGFSIDSTGKVTVKDPYDYEATKETSVKVVVKDPYGGADTLSYVIKIDDVNEPVHAKDTTLSVPEDYTGPIGKVTGTDEDGTTPEFSVSDTAKYSIDSTGTITVKVPFDYETTTEDTVLVFVTDGTFTDTAKVVVTVDNVNEKPVLHPNDSLTVPENCTGCTVGQVIATDGDGDTLTYTIDDPRFDIDSTGKITTKEPVDYETEKEITVKVTVTDPSGAKDSIDYTIKVENVNEPVHVNDTTCSVRENYTGEVCTIPAKDDDGTKPIYSVDDTTNYSIDSTGTLVIKNPIDFEEKTADTVTVIVTDGTFSDTAQVIIRVMDVPEKTTITEVDDKPKQDTVKTNDPDHKLDWEVCEGGVCRFDSLDVKVHKDTTITVCNEKKTSCDKVVILFNDAPPVVTLTNATSTTAAIDYITIEEQKDDKIYVNKKDNPITVTVKDTVRKTEQKFDIEVKLDTLPSKKLHIEDYGYVLDEFAAVSTPIGNSLVELEQVVISDGVKVSIKQVVDAETKEPVEKYQTVSYTTKVDGKDVVVSYQVDPTDGTRKGDFTVSYMLDSCTSVSYTMDEKKHITKNDEGNIGYTIGYSYVDDFGNKAFASVDIMYDDIPPVVEILTPVKNDIFNTNAVAVKWTVNGEVQDTLTLQRLEKGPNVIMRRYVDKAGNEAIATVIVIMKEAKDIDVRIINPVTEVNKEKVDEYYSAGHTYDEKKPFEVKVVNPKSDSVPDAIGIGFLVDIALPSVSPTGGMSSLDDLVKNGQIPVDDEGNIVGASTKGIPVDQYVKEHCTAEFEEDFNQHGLNIPLYDITYYLHLWIWTTTAGYVNDFMVEYTLNDQSVATEAGTVQMVIDWLADKNGSVNASNGHQLGTSSYITTLYSKSVAKHRCDYKEQRKGEKTVKKTESTKIFGYKRPKR